jgi:hypothetical protein
MVAMFSEFAKLAAGLALMLFHKPFADFMIEQERSLVLLFRQRGVPVPPAPTTETGRNIYFCIGAFLALFEVGRIWVISRGA